MADPGVRSDPARTGARRVAVVVVAYNAEAHLAGCLDALAASEWGDVVWRVFVVDNASKDRSASIARGRDHIDVLPQRRNRGFAGGSNIGMRAALEWGADVVALINDDAEVHPGWIGPLLAELVDDVDRGRVGAVQPKLLVHGTDPAIVNSIGVWLDREGSGRDIGFGEPDGPAFGEARSIGLFTGGAVAFRREMLDDVGLFDELLFLYYEDVDLALRGARRGWRYRSVPTSVVRHRVGASTTKAPARRAYYQERNRLLVAARHATLQGFVRAVWLGVRRVRFTPRRAHAAGLVTGVLLVPRQLAKRSRDRR